MDPHDMGAAPDGRDDGSVIPHLRLLDQPAKEQAPDDALMNKLLIQPELSFRIQG